QRSACARDLDRRLLELAGERDRHPGIPVGDRALGCLRYFPRVRQSLRGGPGFRPAAGPRDPGQDAGGDRALVPREERVARTAAGHETRVDVPRRRGSDGRARSMSTQRRGPGKRGPRPRRAVTLRVIAREAGVSASTVSRIINGTVKVSDELKAAVEAAIARHDFRPDAAARGLALGRTLTIGVLSQAIDSPFYAEGLRGVERS